MLISGRGVLFFRISLLENFTFSRIYPCVLELLRELSRQGQLNVKAKDKVSRAGSNSVHDRTRAESARASKGFEAEQGREW